MFPEMELGLSPVFSYAIVVWLGLVLGSFTTAISYRVPRGIPWAFSKKISDIDAPAKIESGEPAAHRSACPKCKANLDVLDLVPVFSWLFLCGKCRHCKAPIPYRYPLIELGVVVTSCLTHAVFGFSPEFWFILCALPFLWSLLVIDMDYLILPNHLVALIIIIGAGRFAFYGSDQYLSFKFNALDHVLGVIIFPLFIWFLGWVMTKILKREALGFGDVKFFAAAGLWLGLFNLAGFCMISGVYGIIFALLWRFFKGEDVFPFGPALIASFYTILLLHGANILPALEI